jgi:hypothetical protein
MANNSIYRTFWGSYIDMERLVSIRLVPAGETRYSRTESYLEMHFQLLDKPIIRDEDDLMTDEFNKKALAMIEDWKSYKETENNLLNNTK